MLTSRSSAPSVVLVDELDQMITKKQDVIYNFFNWPHVAHSRLIVIAIANTMDLPERELSGKIRSRLGASATARRVLQTERLTRPSRLEPDPVCTVHQRRAPGDPRSTTRRPQGL